MSLGFAAVIAWLPAAGAQAYDDGPMCALDTQAVHPSPSSPHEALTSEPVEELFCSSRGFASNSRDSEVLPERATPTAGRNALGRARELSQAGRHTEALLQLEVVSNAFPRLTDRVELLRADVLLASGEHRAARLAYEAARQSVDDAVVVHARVGRVRAMLAADHRDAERELSMLFRRYPELPNEHELRFELGQLHERAGNVRSAVGAYRRIDLLHPGTTWAGRAREKLTALEASGARVRAMTRVQAVERAERLVRGGPFPLAREALTDLDGAEGMTVELRGRVNLMKARMARVEGRWEDARRHMAQGRSESTPEDEAQAEARADRAADMASAAISRQRADAERRIASLKRRQPYGRLPSARLMNIVRIGARAGLADVVDEVVMTLRRRELPWGVRHDLAIAASGVASDEHIAALMGSVAGRPGSLGVSAAYHNARALERLGRLGEAERAYLDVVERDRSGTRWYAMWARQRLWTVRASMLGVCGAEPECNAATANGEAPTPTPEDGTLLASTGPVPAPPRPRRAEGTAAEGSIPPTPSLEAPDLDALADSLTALAVAEADTFPWFGRAEDLLRLGETEAAGEELYQAYLAWREARGRRIPRAGLVSVCRGADRPRTFTSFALRRDRRTLPADSRETIADVAEALGELGTTVGFSGWHRAGERPRAYAPMVEVAATRHGLDPNLLFAIMRVESVYQRRIVSYAGAIGLMQIMPRTGAHIASAMGKTDYTTADLLDPEVNLDFAAWYLASLIERFDGHLPLAIASYNGGPHNVRRWLRGHAVTMPMDAFLEEIPFTQTHRYVRRVLTHYAAYRGQQSLPMTSLDTTLPQVGVDRLAF